MFFKSLILIAIVSFGCAISSSGQDQMERKYLYPVFQEDQQHSIFPGQKPKVNGWAQERIEEELNRGLIAISTDDGHYLSWRLLKEDDQNTTFNIYNSIDGDDPVKLNDELLSTTTDFFHDDPCYDGESVYWITPVVDGEELDASEKVVVNENDQLPYKSIELQGDYMPSRSGIAIADLNGDNTYDFIIKQPNYSIDPGGGPDTEGITYKLEAYLSDGSFLWRKDLGPGIEPGIWYSPFVVYDFDGDNKAEVAVKTAPGVDRDSDGRVRDGEEWISILDGMNGEELARAPWPERDLRYGDYNRLNRNQLGIAYLDGKTPNLLVARGTYKLMVLDAYQFYDNELEQLWHWDGDEQNPVIRSQGAHSMLTVDIDEDERDEVILGSVAIDDNGTAMWSTGFGHPDKMYVSDIDPNRPGMEIFYGIEAWNFEGNGVVMVDATTGRTIWNIEHKTYHVGNAMVADIDPSIPGLEVFAAEDPKGNGNGASSDKYMLSAEGEYLARNAGVPSNMSNWVFWDADLLREMINPDSTSNHTSHSVHKYNDSKVTSGIEGQVLTTADIIGDWREEIITALPGELRIYSTTIPAVDRRVTLMQDPVYRATVAHNSMGYSQTPVTSYYLGVQADEAEEHEPIIQVR